MATRRTATVAARVAVTSSLLLLAGVASADPNLVIGSGAGSISPDASQFFGTNFDASAPECAGEGYQHTNDESYTLNLTPTCNTTDGGHEDEVAVLDLTAAEAIEWAEAFDAFTDTTVYCDMTLEIPTDMSVAGDGIVFTFTDGVGVPMGLFGYVGIKFSAAAAGFLFLKTAANDSLETQTLVTGFVGTVYNTRVTYDTFDDDIVVDLDTVEIGGATPDFTVSQTGAAVSAPTPTGVQLGDDGNPQAGTGYPSVIIDKLACCDDTPAAGVWCGEQE